MATSPEMEPPGFEQIPAPPPSESPPTQIESLNSTSLDAAPPGFGNPNASMAMPGNDTWDPPTVLNKSAELPPLETSSIGNGSGSDEYRETYSFREEIAKQPMAGLVPHVSEKLHPLLPKPEVMVPIKCETVETKTLETLLEPPEIETPMECLTVGPLEAHSATPQKIEILDPAVLVLPPLPPRGASEQTLNGDAFVETQRLSEVSYQPETQIEEGTFETVPKPEMRPGGNEAPFDCQSEPLPPVPVFQSAVSESVSESLGLPPSPPPLPSVYESLSPDSSCENLDPLPPLPSSLPPPPPPALIVHDTPSSMVLKSEYDNLNQNTCDKGLIGDEIPSEHDTVGPAQPLLVPQETEILDPTMLLPPLPPPPTPPPSPPPQFKCESLVLSLPEMTKLRHDSHNQLQPLKEEIRDPPNQETEIVSCSNRDDTPDMLSFETGSPANQVTDEPPMKKSRNMHEIQGQLTPEVYQPKVEKYPLVSETPETNSGQEEVMEALQIDMEMSDVETFDRSPTDMGPPGSDTRDSESLEDAPPGYDKIDPTSQTEMTSQDPLSGMGQMVCGNCHELLSYPHGALHVLCTGCQIINLVLEACQVGNITCGQCSVLLMYPFGAPSVRCSCCRYVTEIRAHNMRPPLSIQQGEGYPTLELQLTEIS